MRVTREKAAENRARIVETASRLFRERGFDGVGLDAIMKDVGLTHGGFYRHFTPRKISRLRRLRRDRRKTPHCQGGLRKSPDFVFVNSPKINSHSRNSNRG